MIELVKHSAAVAVLATLISESTLLAPVREKFKYPLLYCPICLAFWIALPALYFGPVHYLAVVGMSNVFMLVILKVYDEIEKLNGDKA
jgi:hypothetical protein